MDIVQQKATQFVHRLLANPALQDLQPMVKEEQILQFLESNGSKLFPTLSSAAFFPGSSWEQIQSLLAKSLTEIVDQALYIELQEALDRINFGFISFLREQALPVKNLANELLDFQKNLLKKVEARAAFSGPLQAVRYLMPNRYIDQAFRRREYIYFELVKVQKLNMSKEEIKNLILTSLILKNSIHLLSVGVSGPELVSEVVQKQFADKVFQVVKEQLSIFPEPLLRSSLNSNVSFLESSTVETTSRLAAVFAFRAHNYKPIAKVDRGAVSPDKSWFSIARRNYKFYGFDIKMLDELYKIAGENGW